MTHVWLALPIIAALGALAWMVIWSRADTWARPAAVVLFLVAIPVVALAGVETLGRHKPINLAWDLPAGEHLVLAAKLVQDKAIFLYLDDPTRIEPRPLVLPWTNDMANAVQAAIDGAPDGAEGKFLIKRDGTPDGEMTAHAIPQPPSPEPKSAPEPGITYQQGE